jgi:glycosyltransferase involved in cell wall biosynthesis
MTDVSVIIPTFRRPGQLVEAIESVLAQSVDCEIIVLDDSPEGSARSVAERFADKGVTYHQHVPPTGGKPAVVRNAGWPLARGRFVHFLDDDDRVADGVYREAIATFDARPDIGMLFGRVEPYGDITPESLKHEQTHFAVATRRARIAARMRSRFWIVASLLFQPTMLVNSACMIRRECIAPLEGYDVSLGLNEDVDFYCRAARRYGFAFLDRTVLHYRINPDSLMHGRSDDSALLTSYQNMYRRYKATHGGAEFLAVKLLARTLLRAT